MEHTTERPDGVWITRDPTDFQYVISFDITRDFTREIKVFNSYSDASGNNSLIKLSTASNFTTLLPAFKDTFQTKNDLDLRPRLQLKPASRSLSGLTGYCDRPF